MALGTKDDYKTWFSRIADDCYDRANDDQKYYLIVLMDAMLRSFNRQSRLILNQNCPRGENPCPDGSCSPNC